MHDARRPWPVVSEWPRRLDRKAGAIAVAVERERPLLAPLFPPDYSRVAVRRRIARRNDHRGAPAIFLESVGGEGVGRDLPIGEPPDTAERIARHAFVR